ncbi:MAG: HNH endonuclease signature motif containing protein [Burkholderiales bacterium]
MAIIELKQWLSYEPETGVFRWLKPPKPGIKVGAVAGSITRNGYRRIQICGRSYRANRLAWMFSHGVEPVWLVDHIDGNRANDRIANLRDVSAATNSQNRHGAQLNNKTGILGVCKVGKGYRASIQVNGVKRHLGTYPTPELASAAREAA